MAASTYEQVKRLPFGGRRVETANVAMLVWSAGIDVISVHMLLNGETGLGTSVTRRRYFSNRILPPRRSRRLQAGWQALARLHNFQHNLHLSQAEFAANCRASASLFSDLNALLPAALRLQASAYDWLAEVG